MYLHILMQKLKILQTSLINYHLISFLLIKEMKLFS